MLGETMGRLLHYHRRRWALLHHFPYFKARWLLSHSKPLNHWGSVQELLRYLGYLLRVHLLGTRLETYHGLSRSMKWLSLRHSVHLIAKAVRRSAVQFSPKHFDLLVRMFARLRSTHPRIPTFESFPEDLLRDGNSPHSLDMATAL